MCIRDRPSNTTVQVVQGVFYYCFSVLRWRKCRFCGEHLSEELSGQRVQHHDDSFDPVGKDRDRFTFFIPLGFDVMMIQMENPCCVGLLFTDVGAVDTAYGEATRQTVVA